MIERWSWLGEPLAIDFANTVRRRGSEYVEFLDSPHELVVWARRQNLRLREGDVESRLDEVRELRDAVFALLLDAAGATPLREAGATPPGATPPREAGATPPGATPPGAPSPREAGATPPGAPSPREAGATPPGATPPHDAEALLNAALATVPLIPQLREGEVVLTARSGAPRLDRLLACVAASVLDVLHDPALSFCDAPSCGQFFLRHRGDQRWCDPSCGTRARVARHAAHRR